MKKNTRNIFESFFLKFFLFKNILFFLFLFNICHINIFAMRYDDAGSPEIAQVIEAGIESQDGQAGESHHILQSMLTQEEKNKIFLIINAMKENNQFNYVDIAKNIGCHPGQVRIYVWELRQQDPRIPRADQTIIPPLHIDKVKEIKKYIRANPRVDDVTIANILGGCYDLHISSLRADMEKEYAAQNLDNTKVNYTVLGKRNRADSDHENEAHILELDNASFYKLVNEDTLNQFVDDEHFEKLVKTFEEPTRTTDEKKSIVLSKEEKILKIIENIKNNNIRFTCISLAQDITQATGELYHPGQVRNLLAYLKRNGHSIPKAVRMQLPKLSDIKKQEIETYIMTNNLTLGSLAVAQTVGDCYDLHVQHIKEQIKKRLIKKNLLEKTKTPTTNDLLSDKENNSGFCQ